MPYKVQFGKVTNVVWVYIAITYPLISDCAINHICYIVILKKTCIYRCSTQFCAVDSIVGKLETGFHVRPSLNSCFLFR